MGNTTWFSFVCHLDFAHHPQEITDGPCFGCGSQSNTYSEFLMRTQAVSQNASSGLSLIQRNLCARPLPFLKDTNWEGVSN